MKRILFILAIAAASVCALQAASVSESVARQMASSFFAAQSSRFSSAPGASSLRLAYTAEQGRFYIYNRGEGNGFVVVAGDDRLPQVLGYGTTGAFSLTGIPEAMQDWMAEMDREISYLQSNSGVAVHHPVKRAEAFGPLMTTRWNQDEPYNNLCPTYTVPDGSSLRAVTGCVATAMAQIMNYHQWPLQGTGSHSYTCRVNDTDPVTLSADYSQSVYEWDLMLDEYDSESSEESRYAVAKLMSDVGISINMNYGSSSGAQETACIPSLVQYFGYSDKLYLMQRDLFSADEWDQLLVDEISANRPILYCGYTYSQGSMGGHAFVFDGFDTNGYFHVNWGWGGAYDNYFLVSLLAPSSGNNFRFGQDAIFGVTPAHKADEVPDVLYLRGILHPDMYSVARGEAVSVKFSDLYAQGNLMDTVGVEGMGYWQQAYDTIPMELRVLDMNGMAQQVYRFSHKVSLSGWMPMSPNISFIPDAALPEGEYTVKIAYAPFKDDNYDSWVSDEYGNDLYCKMVVSEDTVYLNDCFLSEQYHMTAMDMASDIVVDEPFAVDVTLSNERRYGPPGGGGGQPEPATTGYIHLLLTKNGVEVGTSQPIAISIPRDSVETYRLEMMAPSEWGRYELTVVDDCGRRFEPMTDWLDTGEDAGIFHIVVVPKSEFLVEDFETMTANSKTNETNVEGRFTFWNFNKSGIRAPGEGKCHGTNAVMMKKPSTFYSTVPVDHRFFMAEATFFNNSSTEAKYTLETSVDNGATWVKATTIEETTAAVVPASSIVRAIWQLDVKQPALFRIAMTGGGSASTYVDDFILRYNDLSISGDVNFDGEVNIVDVNAAIDMILSGKSVTAGDVNGDGEVNIADINAIIDQILK